MPKPQLLKEFTASSFPEPHVYDPKSEVVDYECVTPCTAGPSMRLFAVGERYASFFALNKGEIIPRHFKPIRHVIEKADEPPKRKEEKEDFGMASIKSATSWNELIRVGEKVVALTVNRDLSFHKAKEDLMERYLAQKEEG